MKAVIVAGGKAPNKDLFLCEIEDADYLIAADSGVNVFYKYNVEPNVILGDFDSAKHEAINSFKEVEIVKFKPEKDFTDSELAFKNAIEHGADEIVLLGCTGTRLDHTVANIGLLKRALDLNIKAIIKDENNCIFLVSKGVELQGSHGQTISFQAFGESVRNFYIADAKYPLYDYNLQFGDGRTVSNEFIDKSIKIDFSAGIVMVIYSND
ncbi:thiamine diphosphokinase [Clostridium folliculivorans]|uniref:Thiamine diphosphokinase n=1 Tax=Clostridium folliculivorans TaxID=2886038 RepID=A0A9W5Y1G5_9CLOT|nr:thiamine diphosphokinase [Clostridium folliculivorans]GKU24799.1 thiamine pyrophosphokinase [Clostridium folliculivorans]GKU30897.1 thiamine pyrophosphokinase [Clostridium folliculivorans]